MEHLPTQCKAVDALLDGGLATGTITQVLGEKALGKSIISFQAACATAVSGRSAVILDTEQSYFNYLIPYWQERMSKRFNSEVKVNEVKLEKSPGAFKKKSATRGQLISALEGTLNQLGVSHTGTQLGSIADLLSSDFRVELPTKEPSVMVLQIPEVTDVLSIHGIDADMEVSSGGRVELKLRQAPRYQSPLRQIILETGARLLVYDSISAPFKATFPSTQDLPARSAGLAMLLSHAQRLCVEFGIAVLIISHVSIDPINPWDRTPYGGVILGHDAKFSLELTKAVASRNKQGEPEPVNPNDKDEATKAFWVARHPALEEYSRYGYSKLDGEGFH